MNTRNTTRAALAISALALWIFAANARADVIGQGPAPGATIEGRVTGLEYGDDGALVVAILTDANGDRFYVFDGHVSNDLAKFGRALEIAFATGAAVKAHVQDERVTAVELRRAEGRGRLQARVR